MIESKDDYRYYVEQDRKALGYGERRGFAGRMRQLLLPDPIRRFERRLRRCEYLLNVKGRGVRYYLALIAFERLSRKLGFYIPLNVFGPGLSIPHYGTIIVNPAARVGKNCRLHACVNIGASNGSHAAPQIGDNVYIGPSAVIFGAITIADNVTIGANATVNRSCTEKGAVLAGTPAMVIKSGFPVWWETNRIDLRHPTDRPTNQPTNQPTNHTLITLSSAWSPRRISA